MRHLVSLREALRSTAVWWGIAGAAILTIASYDAHRLPKRAPVAFGDWEVIGLHAAPVLWGALTILGALLLGLGWLGLRRQPMTVRPWAVLLLWSIPLLFAAPLFSNDAYSYAAQGRQVMQGVNPYHRGPVVGDPEFTAQVDSFWQTTLAPYGPLSLQMNRGIVELMDADPWASAVGMRIIAVVSVAVIVVALYRLIPLTPGGPGVWERMDDVPRHTAADHAVWLGVLNPIAMIHFIGGAHNDAAMVAFVAVGLAAAAYARQSGQELRREGWMMVGTMCIALGAMIKQPAVVVLPAVAVLAQRSRRHYRPRLSWLIQDLALVAATFLATFVAGSLATQLGFGWVRALKVPGSVASLSPSNNLTVLAEKAVRLIGQPDWAGPASTGIKLVFFAAAAAIGVWLLIRMAFNSQRTGQYVVGILLAFALIMPALQAWYFLWGGVFLGMLALSRRHLDLVCWAVVWLTLTSAIDTALGRVVPAMAIAAVAVLALWQWPEFHRIIRGGVAGGHPVGERIPESRQFAG